MSDEILLSIIEVGGYQDLNPLYQAAGFRVEIVHQMRKAMSLVKKLRPKVIVTEFNFQSDFRDRTSSAESLLATVERLEIGSKVIILYEKESSSQFQRLKTAYPWITALTFPVDEAQLRHALME
jgi:hypothetical protein